MSTISEQIEAKRAELERLEAAHQEQLDAAALVVGRALIAHIDDEEAFVAAAREYAQQHRAAQEKAAQRREAGRRRAREAKARKAEAAAANPFAGQQ